MLISDGGYFTNQKRYDAVGICIYCGANNYNDEREKLGNEHIIPEGLGGRLVLPEASCQSCEAKISQAERFSQKEMLDAFRYRLGIKGKKRKKAKPDKVSLECIKDGNIKNIGIPYKKYPAHILIPIMSAPTLINPKNEERSKCFKYKSIRLGSPDDAERLLTEYNVDGINLKSCLSNIWLFSRMLAKVAHSYTIAEKGINGFQPLLKDFILGNKTNYRPDHFIGMNNISIFWPARIHDITLKEEIFESKKYLVCRVRLFCFAAFPEYIVVVGLVKGEKAETTYPNSLERCFRVFNSDPEYDSYIVIHPFGDDCTPLYVEHIGAKFDASIGSRALPFEG